MTSFSCGQDPNASCAPIGIVMQSPGQDDQDSIYIGYLGPLMAENMYGNQKCEVIGNNNLELCEGNNSQQLNSVFNTAYRSVH